jgi:hypothetical protein
MAGDLGGLEFGKEFTRNKNFFALRKWLQK